MNCFNNINEEVSLRLRQHFVGRASVFSGCGRGLESIIKPQAFTGQNTRV